MDITKSEFTSLITRCFSDNGISSYLSASVVDSFYRLTERMLTENEKYNLTAITEPKRIVLCHYADCVMLASRLKKNASIIDVGCGAGFPTLPLAIVRPDLKITALDSTAKRVQYVKDTAEMLGLTNVSTVTARAEDQARLAGYRESFDYATARAVAEMRVLTELTLPFVGIGGKLIVLKGRSARGELMAAKRAIAMLGGKNASIEEVELLGEDGEIQMHPEITVDKVTKTPDNYPRAYAQISKKPL